MTGTFPVMTGRRGCFWRLDLPSMANVGIILDHSHSKLGAMRYSSNANVNSSMTSRLKTLPKQHFKVYKKNCTNLSKIRKLKKKYNYYHQFCQKVNNIKNSKFCNNWQFGSALSWATFLAIDGNEFVHFLKFSLSLNYRGYKVYV